MRKGDAVIIKRAGRSPLRAVLAEQLGSHGSQGAVYGLEGKSQVAVKVLSGSKVEQTREKINAMLEADPTWTVRANKVRATWPVATVEREDGSFCGYAMHRLQRPGHIPLKMATAKIGALLPDSTWHWHLVLCEDIAHTVADVGRQRHVIGDLAPPNIFVSASAASVIVDVDGWQVYRNNGYFPCAFSRPDYTAPEHLSDMGGFRRPESDWWALAVLIGQTLYMGSHPFGGILRSRHRIGAEEDENVRLRQCWLLGGDIDVPEWTPPRDLVPKRLMRLFERCFVMGYDEPSRRPSPKEWARELDEAWRELVVCTRNHRHLYSRERRTCPWCALVERGQPDHFGARGVPSKPPVFVPSVDPDVTPHVDAARVESPDPPEPSSWMRAVFAIFIIIIMISLFVLIR